MTADAEHEVHEAYRPRGKRAKRVLPVREARHKGHPHAMTNGGSRNGAAELHRHEMPDTGVTRKPRASKMTREHEAMVERNLDVLASALPEAVSGEVEIYKEKMAALLTAEQLGQIAPLTAAKRAQYVALETHREMATVVLSAGGTFDEAADHAGVSSGTVSKWYAEPEFRRRVEEQRAIVLGKVRGRIEAWMERRTADPRALDAADPRVTLAIHDRVAGGGRGAAAQPGAPVVEVNILSYSELMERAARAALQPSPAAEVDVVDGGGESRGFPLIGPGGLRVAGGGAQQD